MGCGPSLADFSKDQINEIAEGKIILAIKQAWYKYPGADYHFLNGNNLSYYAYYKKPYVVIALANNNRIPYLESIANSFFIIEQNTDYSLSLSTTLDFDGNTLDKKPYTRVWGPGILYSVVLYFIKYLGFANLYTIGVDLAPNGIKTRDHFYTNQTINPAHSIGEAESNNEIILSGHFYHWLKDNGVNWYILSKNSYLHSSIPRLNEEINI